MVTPVIFVDSLRNFFPFLFLFLFSFPILGMWPYHINLLLFHSIAEGLVHVSLVGGGDDTDHALRRRLKKESIKTQNGAAMRWAVGAGPDGFLELQLQSLPAPASVINGKPLLRKDIMLKN